MALDLDVLESLARGATKGDWKFRYYEGSKNAKFVLSTKDGADWRIADCPWSYDGEFIAYANPETILSLIAQARVTQEIAQGADFDMLGMSVSKWIEKAKEACRDSL